MRSESAAAHGAFALPWGRTGTLVVVILLLGVAGAGLRRLIDPVWVGFREREPAFRVESSAAAAGQGASLAVLGGFRALVADFVWVRLWTSWEHRDLAATDTLVHLVTAIDPRPVYFWINGARIVAHDFTAWRIEAAGGYDVVPAAAQDRIAREQGEQGLRQIETAMKYHPASPDLWIEAANIELTKLKDVAAAAESYRRASELPGAPAYAARLHAEMLRRIGRDAEALAWLKKLYPTLPAGDEDTAVVLGRIRALERKLNVPPEQAYRPAR